MIRPVRSDVVSFLCGSFHAATTTESRWPSSVWFMEREPWGPPWFGPGPPVPSRRITFRRAKFSSPSGVAGACSFRGRRSPPQAIYLDGLWMWMGSGGERRVGGMGGMRSVFHFSVGEDKRMISFVPIFLVPVDAPQNDTMRDGNLFA